MLVRLLQQQAGIQEGRTMGSVCPSEASSVVSASEQAALTRQQVDTITAQLRHLSSAESGLTDLTQMLGGGSSALHLLPPPARPGRLHTSTLLSPLLEAVSEAIQLLLQGVTRQAGTSVQGSIITSSITSSWMRLAA
jgi:hypothetical protein